MSNNRGFTLVELIVVIMLMGILASSFMIREFKFEVQL